MIMSQKRTPSKLIDYYGLIGDYDLPNKRYLNNILVFFNRLFCV